MKLCLWIWGKFRGPSVLVLTDWKIQLKSRIFVMQTKFDASTFSFITYLSLGLNVFRLQVFFWLKCLKLDNATEHMDSSFFGLNVQFLILHLDTCTCCPESDFLPGQDCSRGHCPCAPPLSHPYRHDWVSSGNRSKSVQSHPLIPSLCHSEKRKQI